ncbi:MAG: VanR-ABDEGLN family response regulator transcription factor [Lachnospiraceae bacterium]|nr:VanR-ABDEGLN family response regulator transcription factor [Lachnospiraceae bacterium]
MNEKILVVDDECEIADLVSLYLENEDFTVFKAYNGADALEYIETKELDLAVLDVMLPDIDGFQICRKIRENYQYPIIMLTAKGEELDKINGLTLGADDYMTKPFLPLEMVARVKAQLRRYKRYNTGNMKDEDIIEHSGLVLNIRTHECILNETPLSLTPTEFSILQILCQHKGEVVSAEELFHQIWKDEYYSKNNNTITVHIRHLREKMGDSFENPQYVKTVWGCGYKIEG